MRRIVNLILISGVCFFMAGVASAQAPPGPLAPAPSQSPSAAPPPAERTAQVAPRKSIMGTWKLNRDESDAPPQRGKQGSDNSGNNGGHGGYGGGGPRMGGGWPGGGMGGGPYGGYGGHRGQGAPQSGSAEEHNHSQDSHRPANTLTLTQRLEKDPEIDLTDDRNHKQELFTDGRKLQDSKNSSAVQIAARWDGNKLVTDEKGPHGGKLSRTFELSPDGLQLWELVEFTTSHNKQATTLRYVYDATDEEAAKQAAN